MAELKVYQRRQLVTKGNAMEEEVQNQSFSFPRTPAKPRSQRIHVRRRLKNNLSHNGVLITDFQLELEGSNGLSLSSADASFSKDKVGFTDPIAESPTKEKVQNCSEIRDTNSDSMGVFDLNKSAWEFDEATGRERYVYMEAADTSQAFLVAKLAAEVVAKNVSEVLTFGDEELLHWKFVTPPNSQSSPNATNTGSFYKMRTCFSPAVKSHFGAEKLKEPIGDMLPYLELKLGTAIPDSMSRCKSDDQHNQENHKQEKVVYHTENEDLKFNAANCISGSTLPSPSSIPQKKNNLKRRLDGVTGLNKRPQKRPKERVYRPRVVGVGRPRRTVEPKTPMKAPPKKFASSKPKTPKPTTQMPASSEKNMSVNKSSSDPKNLVPIEVTVDEADPYLSDRASLNIDMNSQSRDESVIILATPPQKLKRSCKKLKNSSLDSKGSNSILEVDTEAEVRKVGLNFPKICRQRRMMRRKQKVDRWSLIASEFNENASHIKLRSTKKNSALQISQTLVKTKNKRSEGHTDGVTVIEKGRESKEGTAEERLTEMVPTLLNLEFHKNKSNRSLLQNEILQLTEKSIDSREEIISPLEHQCPHMSHRGNLDQDVHVPSNDHGILVPYEGHRDQNTHSPQGGFGMLATYKGKRNKRDAKLSHREYALALSWKLQIHSKVNESQRKEGDEEWWKNEREVFHGRINLLTSRMHEIQGDRKFSPWKGSVVDSVVGVFLTQNVSDHLSSSAFMSLAARFPCQSTANKTDYEDINIVGGQESIGSNIVSIVQVSDEELIICEGATSMENENKESSPNGLEVASRSLSDFCFNKKVDHLGMSSLPPECSSQTKDEMDAQSYESHLYSVNIPLDKPEITVNTMIENPNICMQPPDDANSFNLTMQKGMEPKLKEQQPNMKFGGTKRATQKRENKKAIINSKTDWDFCKRIYSSSGERNRNLMDSVDWEAVRHAEVGEIAEAIKARGQQNIIAGRVKKFLNQVHEDHKQIDLEWLRNAPPELVTKYLREIEGIGLKSIECVRLLALQHVAFPVDVNVGRIAIRLGWVPLQPLPESLQIHLLQDMPLLDSVQKYLWPRLQTLDPMTLYELHYQMITFGKVFCTKRKPSCNSCPMRGECRHYASAFASARLALPGPEKKRTKEDCSTAPIVVFEGLNPTSVSFSEVNHKSEYQTISCEPIIEEPSSPQPESTEIPDIEDLFLDDPNYIPTIKMRDEKFSKTLEPYMGGFQESKMSTELVASEAAYIRPPKLKHVSRLRTKHLVYVLPDHHDLLVGLQLERREPDDPCSYLLAIWTSDETANLFQSSQRRCNSQESKELCNGEKTCFSYSNLPEQASNTIRGTILIPCRTATRGSFPLNGTYFQVNEIFADYETSVRPINVPTSWIWNLKRRTVYFGTSTSAILKGLETEEIMECFWRGFICVRAFDRKTRTPQQLSERFHISTGVAGGKKKREEDER